MTCGCRCNYPRYGRKVCHGRTMTYFSYCDYSYYYSIGDQYCCQDCFGKKVLKSKIWSICLPHSLRYTRCRRDSSQRYGLYLLQKHRTPLSSEYSTRSRNTFLFWRIKKQFSYFLSVMWSSLRLSSSTSLGAFIITSCALPDFGNA